MNLVSSSSTDFLELELNLVPFKKELSQPCLFAICESQRINLPSAIHFSKCGRCNTDLLNPEHALDERVDDLLAREHELRRGLRVLLRGVLLVLSRPKQLQGKWVQIEMGE